MPATIHRTDVQVRFADTDALGHINNAAFATYAEIARLDFLHAIGGTVRSLILASLYVDFRRQMKVDEPIHVESWIEKLGNSSMTMIQAIFAAGERAADIRSVVVHFDYTTNRSSPIPADLRRRLEEFM